MPSQRSPSSRTLLAAALCLALSAALVSRRERSSEEGRRLVEGPANCQGCHSRRDPATGALQGEPFSGGDPITVPSEPGLLRVPPDLRPDPRTGRIAGLAEEVFIARLRLSPRRGGAHLPWQRFMKLSDDELRAIHRYLRSLASPVRAPARGGRKKDD